MPPTGSCMAESSGPNSFFRRVARWKDFNLSRYIDWIRNRYREQEWL